MCIKILLFFLLHWSFVQLATIKYNSPNADDTKYWESYNEARIKQLLSRTNSGESFARNVIIFVGDGMGIQTVTAGRIFKGQHEKKVSGEESELVWDSFPHTGLSKTYNTDRQVPDSAGTATALFSGIKTKYHVVGLDSTLNKSSLVQGKVDSIMKWAQDAGKRTGFVTTTRVTHATPSALYAHSPERGYESDIPIPSAYKSSLKDIARQLVENEPGNKLNVILGGGRDPMGAPIKNQSVPPYSFSPVGMESVFPRSDGLVLTDMWLKSKSNAKDRTYYVTTETELNKVDTKNTEYLLGLFANSHMTYDALRNYTDEPSLAQMTVKAIEVLDRKNSAGYVLMVEGGKIDHAHHQNFARLALHEVLGLDKAVEAALKLVGDDTLILVTADHSHSVTFNGYPERGNDILGFGNKEGIEPYETLSYANGPGFYEHRASANYTNPRFNTWTRVEDTDRSSPVYRHLATVPLVEDTHGGEDVPVYALGPNANLVQGAMEQNFIAYIMSYSGCFGPASKHNNACKRTIS
ncbi:alkaline phosphatase 4-like [Culicoides brevitarsis]|uniref:alkaline phosphatase 4-like n=1 Tax=Culicoides brevitarsis TaxID=469753 RepID=UPI00307B2527